MTTRQYDSPTFCPLQTNAICPHQKTVFRMKTFLSNAPHFIFLFLKYLVFTKLQNIIIIDMVTLWSEIRENLSQVIQGFLGWQYILFTKYVVCNYFANRWSDLWSEKKFPISEAIHFLECFMIYTFGNFLFCLKHIGILNAWVKTANLYYSIC